MPRIKLTLPIPKSNWTKIPNYLVDSLLPKLKDTELRILLVILRYTVGFNKPGKSVQLSYRMLQMKTGRGSAAISDALKALTARGLIHSESRYLQKSAPLSKQIHFENQGSIYKDNK
ncbi:MAG: replication protein [Armatimonadetes bacterium]|nr:replication protein [Armatimonadota bacterium]